jgi:hypothetical protein
MSKSWVRLQNSELKQESCKDTPILIEMLSDLLVLKIEPLNWVGSLATTFIKIPKVPDRPPNLELNRV